MGGKPSRWNTYSVGGSGRPDDYGDAAGAHSEVQSSVWQRWGPNGEYVKQVTPDGKPAMSGAHNKSDRRTKGK